MGHAPHTAVLLAAHSACKHHNSRLGPCVNGRSSAIMEHNLGYYEKGL